MQRGMKRSRKEEHPNALRACSGPDFLPNLPNFRGMLEDIRGLEKGDRITVDLNITKENRGTESLEHNWKKSSARPEETREETALLR